MEENLNNNEANNNYNPVPNNNYYEPKKNNGIKILLVILIILALVGIGLLSYKMFVLDKKKPNNNAGEVKTNTKEYKSNYRMLGNSLEDFDLYFLQLENNNENMVYSPMSIKYALSMLKEGTNGDSKGQIEAVVGDYISKKYVNSEHLSLANALFIRNTYKESVKTPYIDALKEKYNAEVVFDEFKDVKNINKWVSEKTFNLIPNLLDSVDDLQLVLTNALAIDMEWVKTIQAKNYFDRYGVRFAHENYGFGITPLDTIGYEGIKFNDTMNNAKAVEIGAVANKYDIVNVVGEENIRKTVGTELEKWLNEKCSGDEWECNEHKKTYPTTKDYLDKYIKDINEGYKQISSSTDFKFYVDEDVKVFAKDLKEYDGTTLQYIGIMPTNETLSTFIKGVDSKKLNSYITNLKDIELNSFEDGYITEIDGYIPLFNFEYEVNLLEDLKKIGINDVFDLDKANLSNITDSKLYISDAKHKATIEFSNEGIKASAAISLGGAGAAGGGFDYLYEVPVKKINMTFDKPYMFIIRDKDTGEVWFTGSVYEPIEKAADECEYNEDTGECIAN